MDMEQNIVIVVNLKIMEAIVSTKNMIIYLYMKSVNHY